MPAVSAHHYAPGGVPVHAMQRDAGDAVQSLCQPAPASIAAPDMMRIKTAAIAAYTLGAGYPWSETMVQH